MHNVSLTNRGGVEDTRLEAKAKDTKKSEAKAKDSFSEDRHSRGQGQECSRPRPRTQAQVLSKKKQNRSSQKFFRRSPKKKRSSQKFFRRSPQKNVFQKIFQVLHKILTIQKIVLSSSRGQANFRGLEASRPRPRISKSVLEDSTSANQSRSSMYTLLLLRIFILLPPDSVRAKYWTIRALFIALTTSWLKESAPT